MRRVGDGVSFIDTLLGRRASANDRAGYQFVKREAGRTEPDWVWRIRSWNVSRPSLLKRAGSWTGQIEKFDEVAEAVRKVVPKVAPSTKQVAMAMPQSAVITKKIMLPAGLREEEMEMQVEAEANQYIPFSLDEVSLDFCVMGPSLTSAGDVEVLIAASRKDRVQDRQALAEAAGLKPAVLDIESYASRLAMQRIVSALPGEGKDALIALFEIGAENTSLKVLRDDELLVRPRPGFRRLATHAVDFAPVRLLL
jgi:type IV pilus assembly protein PilM